MINLNYRTYWVISITAITGFSAIAYIFLKDKESVEHVQYKSEILEHTKTLKQEVVECSDKKKEELKKTLEKRSLEWMSSYFIETKETKAGEDIYFVDKDIYLGWRTYQTYCHACHGTDATGQYVGETVLGADRPAPPLLNTVCLNDKNYFVETIAKGRAGMPSWRYNPLVNTHRAEQIFLYIVALRLGLVAYAEPRHRHLRLHIENPTKHRK